ncbi:MAG: GGDEF domain-containing protein [Candidatus Tectomicrobia bacterium]|uniref:diguanylate cyclase n=1 Tax=Tectimicrobiota bacterium TaxID=2528274 RepID=A0A932CMZ1_UNCTE|nr:GGDEF domain-containing protein [Candidatus Tectomicrobia bacterium]
MNQRLSLKVLVPLILFTLLPGVLFTGLAERLTERLLTGYLLQRGIEMGRHINQEFYALYFNPRYEIEGKSFDPLDPKHAKALDTLLHHTMGHFQVERINLFSQTGQVLYSTEKGLIGTDASPLHEPALQQALRGEVTSRVIYGFRPDHLHSKTGTTPLTHNVIEIYLPMLCLHERAPNYGQQIGVIELYQNAHIVYQWRRKIRLYLGGMLSLILVILITGATSALRFAALRPIQRMVETLTDPSTVVDGRLVKRIDGGSTYELQCLANAINQMAEEITEKAHQLDEARQMATIDELTSLYNHRYFHRRLEEELSRAERSNRGLALIFCDVDGFKALNDTQGHQAGDLGLKTIAWIIREFKRSSDIACRYGGDEFALILPATSPEEAQVLAERLRSQVEGHFRNNPEAWGTGLTLSIGIAAYPQEATGKKALVEQADWAMYSAKHSGKNRVQVFDRTDPRLTPSHFSQEEATELLQQGQGT